MRIFSLAVLFFLLSCGASAKSPERAESALQDVRLGTKSPYVVFDASGWHAEPGNTQADQVVLHDGEHTGFGMAVWIDDADPGETIEGANGQFGMMLMSAPLLFKIEEVSDPKIISDEESIFLIRGTDWKRGTKMIALCRVKIASGHGAAYWVKVLAFGPEERLSKLNLGVYRVLQSLRVEP